MNIHEGPDRDDSPQPASNGNVPFSEPAFEIVEGPSEQCFAPVKEPSEKRKPAGKERSGLLEAFVLALFAMVLALTLKTYVAEAYEIKGRSMEPTFATGERVVVLKAFYSVERFDIIVFANEEDPPKDLIKRVIGMPGDEVFVEDDGRVVLNGKLLEEKYTGPPHSELPRDYNRLRVPRDHFFVLGDNRPDSHDSRDFRCIPASNVRGKVVIRWWPFSELQAF